jgi:hypothetical protein
MEIEDFFIKTDKEIARAIKEKRHYFYMISVRLPCNVALVESRYAKYNPEIRVCKGCKTQKYDIILTLTE